MMIEKSILNINNIKKIFDYLKKKKKKYNMIK